MERFFHADSIEKKQHLALLQGTRNEKLSGNRLRDWQGINVAS